MIDGSGNLLIGKSDRELYILPKMANRHGLIAGATGTGKTVSLQVLDGRQIVRGILGSLIGKR